MRFARSLFIFTLLAALAPAAASAGPRMYVGFQDDPSFRWTEERSEALDLAQEANATVIRTTVYWSKIAPRRPRQPTNPFDPAYRFDDLDEMVRGAQRRGIEVLLTVWGTPRWAGPAENRLPRKLADFSRFTRALASRYSGRYAGYPHVRFYSIWNEPNREIFLAPQYNRRGVPVAPALYAKLARFGRAGIKAGNRQALVAVGETAAHGRDKATPNPRAQDTMSPGKFAALLAKAKPRVLFDAWAHHPYPTRPAMKPTQRMRWPNVSLASLRPFEKALDKWFKRKNTPIWITEYGHETKPDRLGVTFAKQSSFAAKALTIARKDPRVEMFVWFVLRDQKSTPWQSGLMNVWGVKKPAFNRFAAIARLVDARNAIVDVKGVNPIVRFSALPMGYYAPAGEGIGVFWELWQGATLLGRATPVVPLGRDGWVTLRPEFTPEAGKSYVLKVAANNSFGNQIERTLVLRGPTLLSRR